MTNKPPFEIIAGIEIETEYNIATLGFINKNGYHAGGRQVLLNKNSQFKCEIDSSLHRYIAFNHSDVVELISKPFLVNDNNINKLLNGFKHDIQELANKRHNIKNIALDKALNFNNSCGCHIHFSILKHCPKSIYPINMSNGKNLIFKNLKPYPIKNIIAIKKLVNISNTLLEKVKTLMPTHYQTFKNNFYRRHSKKMRKGSEYDRYREFNLTCGSTEHIEFRSFHLRGITTWADMFMLITLALNTIKDEFNNELRTKRPFYAHSILPIEIFAEQQKKEIELTYCKQENKKEIVLDLNDKDISLNVKFKEGDLIKVSHPYRNSFNSIICGGYGVIRDSFIDENNITQYYIDWYDYEDNLIEELQEEETRFIDETCYLI